MGVHRRGMILFRGDGMITQLNRIESGLILNFIHPGQWP